MMAVSLALYRVLPSILNDPVVSCRVSSIITSCPVHAAGYRWLVKALVDTNGAGGHMATRQPNDQMLDAGTAGYAQRMPFV